MRSAANRSKNLYERITAIKSLWRSPVYLKSVFGIPGRFVEDVERLNTANVDAVVLSACVQKASTPLRQ